MEKIIEIRDVTLSGDGIGHLANGKTVFVPSALPQEKIRIKIVKEKKNFAIATLEEVLEPSPHRIEPECVHAKNCGGCSFWHCDNHFELKQKAAYETLIRISKCELPEYSALTENTPDKNWRIRATYHWDGVRLGFHAKKTKTVVSSYHCLVVTPAIRDAVLYTRDAFRNSRTHLADVRFEMDGDEVFVNTKSFALKKLIESPGIRGIKIQEKTIGDHNFVDATILYQDRTIPIEIPPGQFRQSNEAVNQEIRKFVANEIPKESEVTEFFSGYGNLTFGYIDTTKKTYAFEASADAIALGRTITKKVECENVEFSRMDLFRKSPTPTEVVVLDPPRAGAQFVCERIASGNECSKIIYVSCDPATLARDLKTLVEGGFEIQNILFADMFPRSSHIETLVILNRK